MNKSCHLHTQAAIFRLPLRLPLRPLQQNPRCCSFSESGPPFQTVRKHARRDPRSTNGIFPLWGGLVVQDLQLAVYTSARSTEHFYKCRSVRVLIYPTLHLAYAEVMSTEGLIIALLDGRNKKTPTAPFMFPSHACFQLLSTHATFRIYSYLLRSLR